MQLFDINSSIFQDTLIMEYNAFRIDLVTRGRIDENVDTYVEGNILFSISQQSSAFSRLLADEWNVTTQEKPSVVTGYSSATEYLEDITDTIIKSQETFSLRDSLTQIGEIVEAVGDNLAGILLVSGKTIINPLHPLAALVLIDRIDTVVEYETFKIITYLYTNKSYLKEAYNDADADIEKVKANILSLISLYSNKQNTNKSIKTVETEKQSEHPLANINRFYKETVFTGNEYEGDFVVIPHQILTKGIVAPYYGTSIILREENNAKGAFVTPFQGANVSSPARAENNYNPEFGGVCTGSTDKTTLDGLRTLVHSNLSSPLNPHCIGYGAIMYADECINQSINLYKLGGFIESTNETTIERADNEPPYEEDEASRLERELAQSEVEAEFDEFYEGADTEAEPREITRHRVEANNQEDYQGELDEVTPQEIPPIPEETFDRYERTNEVINSFNGATATFTTTGTTGTVYTTETRPVEERTRFIHPDFQGLETDTEDENFLEDL